MTPARRSAAARHGRQGHDAGLAETRTVLITGCSAEIRIARPDVAGMSYGRTSFANWAMQLETALRSPALAMQLSNVVKTLVLFAMNVPKRTANTTAITSARTPHTIPAMAWP